MSELEEVKYSIVKRRRICKDGRIVVRNFCAAELPKITVTIRSGRTTYRFNGSYDGSKSLPAKLLDHMAKDTEQETEKESEKR